MFILIVIVIFVVVGVIIFLRFNPFKKGDGKARDRSAIILRDANKKLAQNPKNPEALLTVANYHYQQENWQDAYKSYTMLTEVGGSNDEFTVYAHYGICAEKLGLIEEAYKGLTVARSLRKDDFEVNFNLGYIEFQRKNYEKATQLLQTARTANPEDAPTLRCLGHAFFKLNRHKEAMTFIRQAIEMSPDDKESLFVLGECYFEANQTSQALKIFAHLRADPVMGASASLFSGNINLSQHTYIKAIEDYEIGLKHENIKPEVQLEMRYNLAIAYLRQNEIGKALSYLKLIQNDNPAYKDVPALIGRYQELNANKNLQIFLMGSSADFVALCRKIVMNYYSRARVKISDISITKSEWIDINAEIDTPKWSDTVIFRFIRTQSSVGELVVRDLYSRFKDARAGKGICITTGTFSDEAKYFTEARLIDLIEKDRFTSILNSIDSHTGGAGAQKKNK